MIANQSDAILFEAARPIPFAAAWKGQRRWQRRLLEDPGGPEAVWLVEHPACYTLGRGASERHLRFDPARPPAPLHRIDRGGEVTHHMPGQLVLYPVLDLRRRRCDLHWYLRELEQVVLDVLTDLGLRGERQRGLTGVWLEGRKVAAIGVGCRRWITQHGLALNVSGRLEGRAVGRLVDWLPGLDGARVRPLLRDAVARRFDLRWLPRVPPGPGPGATGSVARLLAPERRG